MMNDYQDLLHLAENESRATGIDINTALKEILHYDILYALSQSPLGRYLVFQGGTALRLCYGGNRYSEDLDFVCGQPDTLAHMEEFKVILQEVMTERYGLSIDIKDPKSVNFEPGTIDVGRWTAMVKVTRPNKADKQTQKIRIEVVNVPSHDNEARVLEPNYRGLAPGYASILLRVASLPEILADKIVAVAGRDYLKARDLWDIKWLLNKQIAVDYEMIRKKLADYSETNTFVANMAIRVAEMREEKAIRAFDAEISRFLPAPLQQQMAEMDDFSGRLVQSVAQFLEQTVAAYQGDASAGADDSQLFNPD